LHSHGICSVDKIEQLLFGHSKSDRGCKERFFTGKKGKAI